MTVQFRSTDLKIGWVVVYITEEAHEHEGSASAAQHLLNTMDGHMHAQIFGDDCPADRDGHGPPEPQLDQGEDIESQARTVHFTVLLAATRLVKLWDDSDDSEALLLPVFLTLEDRAALHAFCEGRELNHQTVGDDGNRQLRVSRRQGVDGHSIGEDINVTDDIFQSLQYNDTWEDVRLKMDPRHWMANWFLMAQSKSSVLFKYFCVATSDAMYEVWEGDETVRGTRAWLKEKLKKRFKFGVGVDMQNDAQRKAEIARVDELISRVHRGYWRRHCRFTIAPPRPLARKLLLAYRYFCELDDPDTGRPFFSGGRGKTGHRSICLRYLRLVAKGELSDHPTIPLYVDDWCLRTQSGLEGYHQHFEECVLSVCKHAGLRWTEAATNEFDWRWIVRALRKRGLVPKWVRHYNLALIDYVYDTAVNLLGDVEGRKIVQDWRRSKLITTPLVRHGMYVLYVLCIFVKEALRVRLLRLLFLVRGILVVCLLYIWQNKTHSGDPMCVAVICERDQTCEKYVLCVDTSATGYRHYALEAQRSTVAGRFNSVAENDALHGEGGWVAQRMGSTQVLRYKPTAADITMLLAHTAGTTALQLCQTAFKQGLHLLPGAAEKLMQEAAVEEKARLLLKETGYGLLQSQLRTRRAPPALQEAVFPSMGPSMGSNNLPGPHPGMGLSAMSPAHLEPMDEEDDTDTTTRSTGGVAGVARASARGGSAEGAAGGDSGGSALGGVSRGIAGGGSHVQKRGHNQRGDLSQEEQAEKRKKSKNEWQKQDREKKKTMLN